MSGPVTRALGASKLASAIKPGLQGMGQHSARVDGAIRATFADSIDLDEATRPEHPNDNRWDYLLGHSTTSNIVAVEVHSAETSQVSVVIEKKERSRAHLRAHLASGAGVAAWFWVASNAVDLVPFDKVSIRLTQNGIKMVGRSLCAKHLADLQPSGPARPPAPGRPPTPRRPRR